MGEAANDYEKWVIHVGRTSDINELCIRFLGGKGTLIDAGAAIGWVSVPVAVSGSAVISIEVNPSNCLRLSHAIRYNGLSSMQLVQTAASNFDGLLRFQGDAAWGRVNSEPAGREVLLPKKSILSCSISDPGSSFASR